MKIKTRRVAFCIYAILFHMLHMMVVYVKSDWLIKCGDCKCKWNSGKKTADCKNISLSTIPENLSSELQVLDLSYNRVTFIEENAFAAADLQNLHKLFMRNCSLENLDTYALRGLGILIELDLSNNLLRQLQKDIFISLVKVRSLILNSNLLESLENGIFRNLKYLHKVELKNNRLTRMSTDVFVNVPLLSQIYLSGNRFSFLRMETFERLKRLASLSLEQNPWNCTCELHAFREFVLKRNLYTPPTSCYYPSNLRGMLWIEDQPEAFACKPKIIYPSRGASINTSKENVTLICRVNASPNTLIAWDYNKQMYIGPNNGNHPARVHVQLLREENTASKEFGRDIFISRLTIIGAEKNDEGIYTCLAENAGGRDEVQMSLLVQTQTARDVFIQNNLMIVICLMVLGLLSASIFLAMITCCIYKRFKAINHRHHVHHHQHHLNENGTDQLHREKTNLNGLSTHVGVDGYGKPNDDKYTDIKLGKVGSDSLAVESFTNLTETDGYYREKTNEGPYPVRDDHQHRSTYTTHENKPTSYAEDRHFQNTDNNMPTGVEYQPDLLPYLPQSISFNNSSLYNYSINQDSSCDSQHRSSNHSHPTLPVAAAAILSHQNQRTINYSQEGPIATDTIAADSQQRYANNLTKTKHNIGQSSEYLQSQFVEFLPPSSAREMSTMSAINNEDNNHQHFKQQQQSIFTSSQQHLHHLHHQAPPPPPPYYAPSSDATMANDNFNRPQQHHAPLEYSATGSEMNTYSNKNLLVRSSVVTTSPSLNFFTNCSNQRRELL